MRSWLLALLAAFGIAHVSFATDTPREWSFVLDPYFRGLGGYSALHVSNDGNDILLISDAGDWLIAQLDRPTGNFEIKSRGDLNDPAHMPIRDDQSDAEGLAIGNDGRIYVSFEGVARVWSYSALSGDAAWLPRHPDFQEMQENASLEALAIASDGAIYTIPERSGAKARPFPVYRYQNGEWSIPFTLPRRGNFLVVGADVGPDGYLYVLERSFGLLGFASRIRRFDLNGESEEEIWTGRYDNLEGIALWQDHHGRLIASLISDNNFLSVQKTLLVEVVIDY